MEAKRSHKRKDKTTVLIIYRPMEQFIKLRDSLIFSRMKEIFMRGDLDEIEMIILFKRWNKHGDLMRKVLKIKMILKR